MKNATKKLIGIISIILVIVIVFFATLLFFSVPNGDSIEKAMAKDDYVTITDISNTTPILGQLLPDGANREMTFTKNVNLDFKTVTVIYFDDHKSLNAYKDSIDSNDEQVALSRGKALFIGPKEETTSTRWMLWA